MTTLRSLRTPLDASLERSLDALLRRAGHGWIAGDDAPTAVAGAARGRRALQNAEHGYAVVDGPDVLATGRVGPAEWDSAHFALPIARMDDLLIDRQVALARRRAAAEHLVDTLTAASASASITFARVALDDDLLIRALEDVGFRLFDAQTTWAGAAPTDSPRVDPRVTIREARRTDADGLAELCASSMALVPSHLHADPALAPDKVRSLYAEWARNSVLAGLADHVVVAEVAGALAGFTSAKLLDASLPAPARVGVLPLVAVAAEHRGMGVASAVVVAALRWLGAQGVARCTVGTQVNNIPAARLYASLGLRPAQTVANLHRTRAERPT